VLLEADAKFTAQLCSLLQRDIIEPIQHELEQNSHVKAALDEHRQGVPAGSERLLNLLSRRRIVLAQALTSLVGHQANYHARIGAQYAPLNPHVQVWAPPAIAESCTFDDLSLPLVLQAHKTNRKANKRLPTTHEDGQDARAPRCGRKIFDSPCHLFLLRTGRPTRLSSSVRGPAMGQIPSQSSLRQRQLPRGKAQLPHLWALAELLLLLHPQSSRRGRRLRLLKMIFLVSTLPR